MPLVRVVTFNILYEMARTPGGWPARRPLVSGRLRSLEPDVAGLQEVSPRQAADLAADLPAYEVAPGPASGRSWLGDPRVFLPSASALLALVLLALRDASRPPPPLPHLGAALLLAVASLPVLLRLVSHALHGRFVEAGGHCAIMFRRDRLRRVGEGAFWISRRPEVAGSILRGTYSPHVVHWLRLRLLVGGTELTVYNTHLGHGRWVARATAEILRGRLERDGDGTLQMLVGDLNAAPSHPLLRRLQQPSAPGRAPLADAWRIAESAGAREATFHWRRGWRRWPGRIDHVLLRPAPRVLAVAVAETPPGETPGSDHDPVVADLSLPRSPGAGEPAPGGSGEL